MAHRLYCRVNNFEYCTQYRQTSGLCHSKNHLGRSKTFLRCQFDCFNTPVRDIAERLRWLKREIPNVPVFLWGHGLVSVTRSQFTPAKRLLDTVTESNPSGRVIRTSCLHRVQRFDRRPAARITDVEPKR